MRALLRRPETALFVVALGTYAYFFQAGGWNQNSRFDLVRAVVEEHTLAIDDYAGNTSDLAFFRGHVYSEKAPGLAMMAVPVYAAVHPFAHGQRPRGRLVHLGAYLATVLTVGLPSAVAVALLFHVAWRLGAPAAAAAAVALAYGLATLAFPYATLFYSHQLVAALAFGAFALLALGRRRPEGIRPRSLFAAGLLLGAAVASEYPAGLIAALLGLYALAVTRPWTRVLWMVAGAAVPLLALAAYHTAAFGGPLTVPYATSLDPAVRGQRLLGLTLPDPLVLARILFSTERGLLHHTPWLVLAFPGLALMIRRRATRAEGIACLTLIVTGLLFNASLTRTPEYWRGGAGVGTRVLVPWLPFFALGVAGLLIPPPSAWTRSRGWRLALGLAFAALVSVSAARMLLATAIYPEVNRVDDPFADYYLPRWRAGQVAVNTYPFHDGNNDAKYAWNLGERMGLEGRASLVPLAAFVVAAGAWVAATAKRRAAPDGDRPPDEA